jgi:hypothetical protein
LDGKEETLPATPIIENAFDYRAVLLWLSLGCLGVFIFLHLILCVKKSESKRGNFTSMSTATTTG